jgi:hypothetical protein
VPVECQVITGRDDDGGGSGDVAEDVAAHVDGVEVFNGRVVVAAFAGGAVVCGRADAAGGSLVDAVYEDALSVLISEERGWRLGERYPDVCVGTCLAR